MRSGRERERVELTECDGSRVVQATHTRMPWARRLVIDIVEILRELSTSIVFPKTSNMRGSDTWIPDGTPRGIGRANCATRNRAATLPHEGP